MRKDKKEEKTKKCDFKCDMCEHYSRIKDFCKEKQIENCSKNSHTDFSKCESFLVRENLVMF